MQIFPVRNEQDHSKALARIEKLMDADLTAAQGDELDALVTLVSAYEEKHYRIAAPNPVTAIEFWMDQHSLSRKELEPALGSRARISEVLNGKRTLTLGMIRKLHTMLGIPVDLLVGEPDEANRVTRVGLRKIRSPQEKKISACISTGAIPTARMLKPTGRISRRASIVRNVLNAELPAHRYGR